MNYKDILFATTRILGDNFTCDTFIGEAEIFEEKEGDKECFVVDVVPIGSEAITQKVNEKNLLISIKYFTNIYNYVGNTKYSKSYDVADKLESVFARTINVNGIKIYVSKLEPNFLNDEVGEYLDFLIYTSVVSEMVEDSVLEEYPPIVGDEGIKIPIETMEDINIK